MKNGWGWSGLPFPISLLIMLRAPTLRSVGTSYPIYLLCVPSTRISPPVRTCSGHYPSPPQRSSVARTNQPTREQTQMSSGHFSSNHLHYPENQCNHPQPFFITAIHHLHIMSARIYRTKNTRRGAPTSPRPPMGAKKHPQDAKRQPPPPFSLLGSRCRTGASRGDARGNMT